MSEQAHHNSSTTPRVFWGLTGILSVMAMCLLVTACGGDGEGGKTFVSIGTGSQTGVYYPVGGHVAELVSKNSNTHGIKASHEATNGSVYNINAVIKGDLEFGIAQSDRQYQAVKGEAEWDGKPQADLRAVCSLHPEVITLVADASLASVADLKGKQVNLGNPGSGQRQNAIDVLSALGLNPETDISAQGLKASEAPKMLQDSRIDAFFYTVGHPSGAITQATTGTRKVRIIPLTGLDALLQSKPYYAKASIPANTYDKATDGDKDVESIGMVATLVTSAKVSDKTVYEVTKSIFVNLERFRKLHPALSQLTTDSMRQGLTAPLHPGAKRYLKEAGLMPE